jgi:hypothetical protein
MDGFLAWFWHEIIIFLEFVSESFENRSNVMPFEPIVKQKTILYFFVVEAGSVSSHSSVYLEDELQAKLCWGVGSSIPWVYFPEDNHIVAFV